MPQAISEELDKRLGPAPVGAMEEAMAERARVNKRIRELRKAAKNKPMCVGATSTEPIGPSPAPLAENEQSAEERPAKRHRNDTRAHDVQLTAETLPQMLPDIVDAVGQLKHDRCMSLIEPLLPLGMLRGKKKHKMRRQKWKPGPYFLHVGQKQTSPEFTSKLAETWPDAPPSEALASEIADRLKRPPRA